METKTKEKGSIKKSLWIKGDLTILNGDESIRKFRVPCCVMEYDEPESANDYTKQQHFKLWFKLESSEYNRIENQIKKDLKELSIWLDEENLEKLKEFLRGEKE